MSEKSKQKKGQHKGEKSQKGKSNVKGDAKEQRIHQREREVRNNKQDNTNTETNTAAEQKPEEPAIDTVALFANLKRETDEILKITESAKSKYAKREIRSNWTKYELPVDNYEIIEDSSLGANFDDLLQMPISRGGHFQFKHEKSWVNDRKPTQYTDLFTLDGSYISSALNCIPFYERNRLDPALFSTEQVTRMVATANKNMGKFKKNLPIEKLEKELSKKLLKKLKGHEVENTKTIKTSEIEINDENMASENVAISNEDASNDLDEEINLIVGISNLPLSKKSEESIETGNEEMNLKKLEKIVIDDEDDLDEILSISNKIPDKIPENNIVKAPSETPPNPVIMPATATEVDLDKWLDDYLDT